MIKRVLFSVATFALAVASAASSYRITVYQSSFLNGTEIQPGEYRLELKENTAVITKGKQTIEAPVKVETTDQKAPATSVRYSKENGKTVVDEIRLGGTNTRLVFRSSAS
jgi:hypothetical protein